MKKYTGANTLERFWLSAETDFCQAILREVFVIHTSFDVAVNKFVGSQFI